MKARILFLAAALTLAALPARAQTELQELVAAAYEAEAQDMLVLLQNARGAEARRERASQARENASYAQDAASRAQGKASAARIANWESAAQAWEAVADAWEVHPEGQLQAEKKAKREAAADSAAERERERQAVARAYWAQVGAWNTEADFDFVKYDGFDEPKRSKAAGARINASRARDNFPFAREQASRANLHALRARENASDWRRTAGRETGGLKELANKAAQAWESAAQAWEAVGE